MTPIGHSLTGIAVAAAVAPSAPRHARPALVLAIVVCANLPDAPLPGWGHDRYDFSHSVFVGAALCVAGVTVLRLNRKRWPIAGSWPVIAAGIAALYSHYLLDCLYNRRPGMLLFWPVSDVRVALPVPWFQTMTLDPLFGWHNLRVWGIEFVCYGTLTAIVLLWVAKARMPRRT